MASNTKAATITPTNRKPTSEHPGHKQLETTAHNPNQTENHKQANRQSHPSRPPVETNLDRPAAAHGKQHEHDEVVLPPDDQLQQHDDNSDGLRPHAATQLQPNSNSNHAQVLYDVENFCQRCTLDSDAPKRRRSDEKQRSEPPLTVVESTNHEIKPPRPPPKQAQGPMPWMRS